MTLSTRLTKIAAALILTLASGLSARAQLTASKAFAEAPHELFPLLTDMTRLDMIDYYASGTRTASRNVLDGESRIEEMSPAQMRIKMSDVSDYTITILPAGRDSVIAVIGTLLTPTPDSFLALYSADWEPLDSKKFSAPGLSQWLLPEAKSVMADIENAIPFVPVSYDLNPTTGELTLTQNLKQLLPEADYELVKDYVKPRLIYRWNGSKMTPVKK